MTFSTGSSRRMASCRCCTPRNGMPRTRCGADKEWEDRRRLVRQFRYLRGLIITSRDRRTSLISVSVGLAGSRTGRALVPDAHQRFERRDAESRADKRSREHIQYLRKQIEVEAKAWKPGRPWVACSKRSSSRRCSRRFPRTTYRKLSARAWPRTTGRTVRPRRMVLAAIGFLFGSGLGVLLAFLQLRSIRKVSLKSGVARWRIGCCQYCTSG